MAAPTLRTQIEDAFIKLQEVAPKLTLSGLLQAVKDTSALIAAGIDPANCAADVKRLGERVAQLDARTVELETALDAALKANPPIPANAGSADAFKQASHSDLCAIAARLSAEVGKLRAELTTKRAEDTAAKSLTERCQAALATK